MKRNARTGRRVGEPARWYAVASRTTAVFYEELARGRFLFVERLRNPQGSREEKELGTDRPGRSFSSSGGGNFRHALDRNFHRHERSAQRFAAKIAKILDKARLAREFRELVVVAEPHFLGLLRKEMSPSLRALLRHEIPREYVQGSVESVRRRILRVMEEQRGAPVLL